MKKGYIMNKFWDFSYKSPQWNNKVIKIYDKKHLDAFYCKVTEEHKTFKNQIVRLMNDIDLSEYNMQTIGGLSINNSELCYFAGEFDGFGYTIHNYKIHDNYNNLGFFAINRGYIHDLHFDNPEILSDEHIIGLITSVNYGKISGCSISNSYIIGRDVVGGIVGINEGIIENCDYTGQLRTICKTEDYGSICAIQNNQNEFSRIDNTISEVNCEYIIGEEKLTEEDLKYKYEGKIIMDKWDTGLLNNDDIEILNIRKTSIEDLATEICNDSIDITDFENTITDEELEALMGEFKPEDINIEEQDFESFIRGSAPIGFEPPIEPMNNFNQENVIKEINKSFDNETEKEPDIIVNTNLPFVEGFEFKGRIQDGKLLIFL